VYLLIKNFKLTLRFKYYSYDPTNYTINLEIHPTKPLDLEGNYKMSGKVLVLPVVGDGKCKIILGNIINLPLDFFE